MASPFLEPPETLNKTQKSRIKLTFEEYINYHDHTDNRHELIRGNLVTMPTATTLHTNICQFLLYKLQNHLVEFNLDLVATNDMGVRTLDDTVRIPDVVVYELKIWENIHNRKGAGVLYFGESPKLVVEVTSQNWREDYVLKKAEYMMIDIPEYWIVDPHKKQIRICTNSEKEEYQFEDYLSGETIKSRLFPDLNLTVDEIISPSLVENLIKQEKNVTNDLKTNLAQEKQRADKLEALLRENGINLDHI